MIDINFIRENPQQVKLKAEQKGYPVDIDKLLAIDDQRRKLLAKIDGLRNQRNAINQNVKNRQPTNEEREQAKSLREVLATEEASLKVIEQQFNQLMRSVPNMPLDIVPVGASEDDNVVVETLNQKPQFSFAAKPHYLIGESRNLIDKTRAAKIAGSRFAYLKGDLVRLQFAIISFAIDKLRDPKFIDQVINDQGLELSRQPFIPVIPPAMLKTEPYQASSRLNAEEVTYKIEQDELWLNASAEHTLCTMMMDEIIPLEELPLRLLGYSTSFRREAGTYGKDEEGIFRLHQFDKLEMEVFSTPETALEEHKLLVGIQKTLLNLLQLPYQVIEKCTMDIGKPNAKGVDINTWFPGQNKYRETHSADYIGDYQARDLKIRTRNPAGNIVFVHTNDATVFALGRIMAALIENFQNENGTITVPMVLRPYMGNQETI